MQFIPIDDSSPTADVPYFGEARADDGWQGQGTTRSYGVLKSDVTKIFARLGGIVHCIQRGIYKIGEFERGGVRIDYSITGPSAQMLYGRLDVAALPVKKPKQRTNSREVLQNRMDKSLCMALYNVCQSLKAQWVLKQMNPAYVPLMPWLLVGDEKTLTELYGESSLPMLNAPAPENEEVVTGEFTVMEEEDEYQPLKTHTDEEVATIISNLQGLPRKRKRR